MCKIVYTEMQILHSASIAPQAPVLHVRTWIVRSLAPQSAMFAVQVWQATVQSSLYTSDCESADRRVAYVAIKCSESDPQVFLD